MPTENATCNCQKLVLLRVLHYWINILTFDIAFEDHMYKRSLLIIVHNNKFWLQGHHCRRQAATKIYGDRKKNRHMLVFFHINHFERQM